MHRAVNKAADADSSPVNSKTLAAAGHLMRMKSDTNTNEKVRAIRTDMTMKGVGKWLLRESTDKNPTPTVKQNPATSFRHSTVDLLLRSPVPVVVNTGK
uniref:Uncharacterized protein n=1 Tax=Kalanchoe fedtschenkoi TaxID=63787 RepID=A0A7N0VKD3_KALFE